MSYLMKHCSKCKTTKPISDFSYDKKSKDGRCYYCRKCATKVSRDTYKIRMQNPEYREAVRKKGRDFFREIKRQAVIYMGECCYDCKIVYPDYIYEFHHLDPMQKDVNPSKAFRLDFDRVKVELDKCVMLCANCHRERHFGRK